MSSKSKIIIGVCSVFVIFAVVLTLYLCWPAIEGTINGSRYYTEDDVQSAYDEGYNDGITNKDELTAQIEAYKLLIEQNEITISDLNSQIEILTKQNQEYILNNEELNDTIDSLNTQIDNLGKTIADNEETISDLNNTIIELNNTIDELEEEQSSNSALITSLQEQISSLQNQIQSLNSTNSQHQATIESLNATITSLNSQISDYEDSQLSLNTQIATLQQSILDYQQQIENYLEIIEDLKEINACVVTFTVDGQVISTQQVNKTEYPTQIEDPVSEDYIFDGWMIEGTDEIIDPFTYSITEDTNFVASIRKYKVVTFTVDDSVISTQNILNNNELEIPSPTKEHYTFLGWSLDGESIIDLSSYTITADTNFIAVFEITGVLPYTFSGNTLTGYTGTATNVTLPTSYSIVDGYYIEGNDYSVTEIGNRVFENNTLITSVIIPDSYMTIGQYAFNNCSNLLNVSINSTKLQQLTWYAFANCESLINVDLENCIGLINIINHAFYKCSSLLEIDLSNCKNLALIGDYAFGYCTLLKDITLPLSIESISSYSFLNCSSLININLEDSVNLQEIGGSAFRGCSSLKSVIIPCNVTEIGTYVFADCSQLNTIKYNASNISYSGSQSLFTFDNSGTSGDLIVIIGNSVKNIPNYLFHRSLIKEVFFEDNSQLQTIGDYAFASSYYLTNIEFPSTIETIGKFAFNYCSSLTNVDLGHCNSLSVLDVRAFGECESLMSITIPSNVTSIEDAAFLRDSNLNEVILMSDYVYDNVNSDDSCGYLLENATIVKVLKTIDDGSNIYLNSDSFTKTEDGDYYVYTRVA